MNKSELIEVMASDAGISKAAAERVLNSLMNNVKRSLKYGDKITIVGFGSFSVKQRAARNGRNPQTGGVIKIPARKVVSFKAGTKLKQSIKFSSDEDTGPLKEF